MASCDGLSTTIEGVEVSSSFVLVGTSNTNLFYFTRMFHKHSSPATQKSSSSSPFATPSHKLSSSMTSPSARLLQPPVLHQDFLNNLNTIILTSATPRYDQRSLFPSLPFRILFLPYSLPIFMLFHQRGRINISQII